jgi:hypothetical protein
MVTPWTSEPHLLTVPFVHEYVELGPSALLVKQSAQVAAQTDMHHGVRDKVQFHAYNLQPKAVIRILEQPERFIEAAHGFMKRSFYPQTTSARMRQIRRIADLLNIAALGTAHAGGGKKWVELFKIHPVGDKIVLLQRPSHGCQPTRAGFVIGVAKYDGVASSRSCAGVARVSRAATLRSVNQPQPG